MKVLAFGKVKDGKLTLNNQIMFGREIKSFEGKDVMLTLEKKSKKRSVQQSRYYFGVVVNMVWQRFMDLGNEITRERTHEVLRYKFLRGITINPLTGEEMEYIQSTTELSTSEAMDYYASIQKWAAEELEIYIPDPHEFMEETAQITRDSV